MKIEKQKELIETAKSLASALHSKQQYALGLPYFKGHICAVVEEVKRQTAFGLYSESDINTAVCVAYLHDILEDTPYTYQELHDTFGYKIADAVVAITKTKDETYKQYLVKVQSDYYAALVKKADAMVNLRFSMMTNSVGRVQKYLDVIQTLSA